MYSYPIIVIQAADQDAANAAVTALDAGNAGTFSEGLNPSGSQADPITHYWASPGLHVPDEESAWHNIFPLNFSGSRWQAWNGDDAAVPDALLADMGLKRISAGP